MEFKNGTILRDYYILRQLGTGGMGEIYLAEEALLDRQVAIKRLNPQLTSDPQFSERFINEARIQAKLQHQNIVSLYNFFVEDGIYYMVMEYAPGITLKELIAKTGPIPEQRTMFIFRQIIDALGYAHEKQIIHRDIKPSNIIIAPDDNVKVMDFGIARLLSDKHLTHTGAKLGTLFYMSPEQVKAAKDIDHRTDIYSAGIVLYEMLTGKLPYKADTDSDFDVMLEIVNNELPDPRETYKFISDKAVAAIYKATQKQRESRYHDCRTLLSDCLGQTSAPYLPPHPTAGNTGIKPGVKKPPIIPPVVKMKPTPKPETVLVEGGSFLMGSDEGDKDEKPVHKVTVSSFYLSKFPVTQKEWLKVMGNNPSHWKGDILPVVQVSWDEAVDYCIKRSILEGLKPCYSIVKTKGFLGVKQTLNCDWTANGYRLPTEAEWEYAAWGGMQSQGYKYSGSEDLDKVAWYCDNSGSRTHEVGTKLPNELGIYDMSGNVWEWCWDWVDGGYYATSPEENPRGPEKGMFRLLRGGSWAFSDYDCRVGSRNGSLPDRRNYDVGFRVLRAIL